jgi:hypothetical protein
MQSMIRCFIVLILPMTILLSQGKNPMKRTFTVGEAKVECLIQRFDPPTVMAADPKQSDQKSAVNCSRLFYSLLANGDIEGAANLSNDPEKVRKRFAASRDRVGEAEFKTMIASYFAGGVTLKYVFAFGERQMLIVHDKEVGADMAQFYVSKNGVWMSDDRQVADMGILAKLFQQLKNAEGIVDLGK